MDEETKRKLINWVDTYRFFHGEDPNGMYVVSVKDFKKAIQSGEFDSRPLCSSCSEQCEANKYVAPTTCAQYKPMFPNHMDNSDAFKGFN